MDAAIHPHQPHLLTAYKIPLLSTPLIERAVEVGVLAVQIRKRKGGSVVGQHIYGPSQQAQPTWFLAHHVKASLKVEPWQCFPGDAGMGCICHIL